MLLEVEWELQVRKYFETTAILLSFYRYTHHMICSILLCAKKQLDLSRWGNLSIFMNYNGRVYLIGVLQWIITDFSSEY